MPKLDLLNVIVSAALVGFVWLVQLSYYPAFRFVEARQWKGFHEHHTKSISIIAMPLMLTELALGIYFVWMSYNSASLICLALIVIAWLNTFFQAVPIHTRMGKSYDRKQIDKLIQVNWIRTLAWTIKLCIVGFTF